MSRGCPACVPWWPRWLVVLVYGLAMSGCASHDDPYLTRVQQAGVLRVGLDPSWPPFEFVDEARGEVAGLDVDLARAIGRELGVEVAFVVSGWEGLYGALYTGQFDAIVSALPYDPWRTREALYSISYLNVGPVIVVHVDEQRVTRPKDLVGRTVHVEYGSEGDVQARRLAKKVSELAITTHDTAADALSVMDEASVAIVDAVSARLYIREHPHLKIVDEPLYDELYVVAVHPRAQSLQAAIDQALVKLRESGDLGELLDRWL